MADPGRAAMQRAHEAGTWEAALEVNALVVPDDLRTALDANAAAAAWFGASAPSYRRNALRWIAKAVRPATRTARVTVVVAHAARSAKVPNL